MKVKDEEFKKAVYEAVFVLAYAIEEGSINGIIKDLNDIFGELISDDPPISHQVKNK